MKTRRMRDSMDQDLYLDLDLDLDLELDLDPYLQLKNYQLL